MKLITFLVSGAQLIDGTPVVPEEWHIKQIDIVEKQADYHGWTYAILCVRHEDE